MPSSFFGLYVQREALLVAQKSLDIVGNNVSNINTPGYTRQRIETASVANKGGGLMSNTAISMAGQGVRGVGVAQLRDVMLDKKYRTYTSTAMDFGIKVQVMSDVETAIDNIESDTRGFNKVLSDFKAALQGFSAENANRREMATISQSTAKNATDYLRILNSRLDDISKQTLGDTMIVVDRVNAILAEMGDLNKQISDSYVSMGYLTAQGDGYRVMSNFGPLELKDKMNMLLDELSQYGNIDFKEESNGSFTVKFAGQEVVDDRFYAQIAIKDMSVNFADVPTTAQFRDAQAILDNIFSTEPQIAAAQAVIDEYNNYYHTKPEPLNMGFVISNYKMESKDWRAIAPSAAERQTFVLDESNAFSYRNSEGRTISGAGVFDITSTAGDSSRQHLFGGSLRAYLDTYNGNGEFAASNYSLNGGAASPIGNNTYRGIEYYRNTLNAFAKTFADEMNSIFYEEFGFRLFDYQDDMSTPTTNDEFMKITSNLRLSEAWTADPILVSKPYWANTDVNFAKYPPSGVGPPPFYTEADKARLDEFQELDNSWIHKMLGAFESQHGYGNLPLDSGPVTFQKFLQHIGDTLGSQVNAEMSIFETNDIMLRMVEDERDAIMGVQMDEEGIDMMNYQKWYNAIARMTSTLDEALDTLINRTGRVGL
ncbi:MAG: flagellar basal body protein [Oscillospiraceae bacterium]|nr:flagellar basal body protein [Oscillospiraceae bacterium]